MKIRRIVEDYEAKLVPSGATHIGSRAKGKAEWEAYGDGGEQLSIRIRNIELAEGTIVDVLLSGGQIGQITVVGNLGELRITSENAGAVPPVRDGDTITVALQGSELLTGVFVPD